jgi:hypothetical protein
MSDSVVSVYSDARTEYTKQLCVFLVPAYFQFFLNLLQKARDQSSAEPKKLLWQFQTLLNDIPEWNMEKVNTEITNIQSSCGCDYLDDLLTAVFIAHTKVLTAIRISSKQKKVQINVPKVEHFLFKALCETSKLLWGSTYLFREDVTSIEKQQNYRSIEGLLQEGMIQAVRALVPVKSILRDFVSSDETDDEAEEEDEKKSEETKPEEHKPEETKPEDTKPEDTKPEETKPEETKPEETKPEEARHEEPKPEQVQQPIHVNEIIKPLENSNDDELESAPPVIRLDERPEVSFADLDEVFDTDNPEGSDIVAGEPRLSSPGLEILDEDAVPLGGDDVEDLDGGAEKSEPLDDYEVLV